MAPAVKRDHTTYLNNTIHLEQSRPLRALTLGSLPQQEGPRLQLRLDFPLHGFAYQPALRIFFPRRQDPPSVRLPIGPSAGRQNSVRSTRQKMSSMASVLPTPPASSATTPQLLLPVTALSGRDFDNIAAGIKDVKSRFR